MPVFEFKSDKFIVSLVTANDAENAAQLYDQLKKSLTGIADIKLKLKNENAQHTFPTLFIWYFSNSKK